MKKNEIKSLIVILLALALAVSLIACGRKPKETTVPSDLTEPVETEPTVTEPPETEPPVTAPVATEPPATEPVETEPVETEPPETEPVETEPLCEHKFYKNPKHQIPTCQAEGYDEYTCKICGEKVKMDFKPIVDHLYVREILEYASCTSGGKEAMVCTYCGDVKETMDVEAYGHRTAIVEANIVSLTHHTAKISRCEECSQIFDIKEYLEKHNFTLADRVVDKVSDGGYTAYGYEIFVCDGENCDYTLYVSANASDGHYYVADEGSGKMYCMYCGPDHLAPANVEYNDNPNPGPQMFSGN